MSSNEHPDMHGNPAGAPFLCDHCGEQFREEDAWGTASNDERFFCSESCVISWEDNQIASFYGD